MGFFVGSKNFCKPTRMQQCTSTILIYLWQFRYSRIRQQSYRLESSAKINVLLCNWDALNANVNQTKVCLTTQKERRTVYFVTLMDICLLKNAELESKYQKYKSRVVLRGDIEKDDSGSYAVFTQMTAAKVMDVTSRLPRCAKQAADAVFVYTRWKWRMLQNCWKFQSQCPDVWKRCPRHKCS